MVTQFEVVHCMDYFSMCEEQLMTNNENCTVRMKVKDMYLCELLNGSSEQLKFGFITVWVSDHSRRLLFFWFFDKNNSWHAVCD